MVATVLVVVLAFWILDYHTKRCDWRFPLGPIRGPITSALAEHEACMTEARNQVSNLFWSQRVLMCSGWELKRNDSWADFIM
jgi:hypothetical protein